MTPSPWRRMARRPPWVRVALLLVFAGALRLAWDLVVHWHQLRSGDDLRFALLLLLRGAALAAAIRTVALAAVRQAPVRPGPGPRYRLASALCAGACIMLAAIAVASLVHLAADLQDDRFAVRSAFRSTLLLATSVWVGLLIPVPGGIGPAPRGRFRSIGVALTNLFVILLVLEAVALVFARVYPTRLMWDERSARATVEANRLEPGARYLGFAANSDGYYDDEFYRAGADDLLVAVVADSFGVGIVPHKYNFTTIAEKRLARDWPAPGRVAVHNFGVAAIGMPEYAWLMENEVPATAPSRIVLGLFVGNDISGLASRRRHGFYSLQQLQLFEFVRRLAILGRSPQRVAGSGEAAPGRRGPPPNPTTGTFDEETYLDIERAAVELCNTRSRHMERLYRAFFGWLARVHAQAGEKLLVVLIPDEYQVNDDLYEALMRRTEDPTAYDRLVPQRRITSFCRRHGIEVVDLLGPLRQANSVRPVYRLRDTHWNARGNRIAGEVIAQHLLGDLAR